MVAVAAVVLAAGVTTAAASATPASKADAANLKPSPNKNTRPGSASPKSKASAQARKTQQRVEVVSSRTETDTVWANPDGTFSQETAQAPIRAKDAAGKLAPIDTDLVSRGGRLAPKVATGDVAFSADGTGEGASFNLTRNQSVGLSFKGDLGAPTIKNGSATYAVKTPTPVPTGETVRLSALPNGFTSNVLLSQAPTTAPTYTFTLHLNGLSASLKDNALQLAKSDGTVVAQSRRLQMWDSRKDAAGDPATLTDVDAKLTPTTNGDVELTLTPSMAFLTDPQTQYPVTIDPDISALPARGDTYYFNGQSTSDSRGSDYRLRTGFQDGATYRSLVTFGYKQYVGQTVTAASLTLRQYSSATCTNKTSNLFPVTADSAATITWNTKPTVSTDGRWKSSKSFNHGQGTCPDAFESQDVTAMVSAWSGGQLNGDTAGLARQGIEMRASSENDGTYDKRFCSLNLSGTDDLNCNDAAYIPVLSVPTTTNPKRRRC